jgi:hypothetical protein
MTCELLQISEDDIVTGLKLGVNKLQVHVYLMEIMIGELLYVDLPAKYVLN